MAAGRKSRKRLISNSPAMTIETDSVDISSDLAFCIGDINSDDIFLRTLLSSQITTLSFSDLYEKSQSIGWKQVLIELRNNLKLDEKSKPKRLMLNRSIEECSTNADSFNNRVVTLETEMKKQLSNLITSDQECFNRLQTMNDVYAEINKWRKLQCNRRLFHEEYKQRCPLPVLQKIMTDRFIQLLQSPQFDAEAFKDLLDHCLIIVVQPSGTDSSAVTKYEKVGEAYVVKIKTRIICLLEPTQIKTYLQLFNVQMTLYLEDRTLDPCGEVQSPLQWRKRIIKCADDEERAFLYVELDENDAMKLTKRNSNRKPLYNNRLCQLEFQTIFKFIGTDIKMLIKFNSQFFGLCSHAKYNPKYLAKVFLEELKDIDMVGNIHTQLTALERYICKFHARTSGVDAKLHTRTFIREKLKEVYKASQISATSRTDSVSIFKINIYQSMLEKLFSQMKFMGSHAFLSMMYFDSLFLGICTNAVDEQLNSNTLGRPQLVMRFALPEEQEKPNNLNIIFAVHNGTLHKSRVTHDYMISDTSTCICAAVREEGNQIQVWGNDTISPFSSFGQYHDSDLSHDNLIQMTNATRYFPLNTILRNTVPNGLVQPSPLTEQANITSPLELFGQLSGGEDLIADAITFLQQQFAHWCAMRNTQCSLTLYSLENMDINGGFF